MLDDPVAARLLDPRWAASLRTDSERWRTPERTRLRTHVVVRSRFAEDRLAAAVARGVRQAVILGAGYDTFAFRQPAWAQALHIVEIDQPATQADKRARLSRAGIAIPPNVTFHAVDFERTPLAAALPAAIDVTRPAFFSWLGVIPYLGTSAIEAVFRAVAALPRESEIAFSFAGPRTGEDAIETAAEAVGEPWRTRLAPEELDTMLRALGYREVRFLSPADVADRYLSGRGDDLQPANQTTIGTALV